MNIRMTPLAFQSAIDCFTCGERLEPDVEIATAHTPSGIELGPVCTRCVESDAPHLRQRVQHQTVRLRQGLIALEHLVGEEHALTRRN
jgi:hypothetical protein